MNYEDVKNPNLSEEELQNKAEDLIEKADKVLDDYWKEFDKFSGKVNNNEEITREDAERMIEQMKKLKDSEKIEDEAVAMSLKAQMMKEKKS